MFKKDNTIMIFSDKQLEEFITNSLIINNTESYFSSSRIIFPYGWMVLSKYMKNNEKEKHG